MSVIRDFKKLYKKNIDPWDTGGADSEFYESTLDVLKTISQPIQRALDLGCGLGTFTARVKSELHINSCIGIDISPDAIQEAEKRYPDITFHCADMRGIQFEESEKESFDLVMVFDILPYFTPHELRELVKKIKKILKPGGMLCIRSWTPGGLYISHDEIRGLIGELFTLFLEKKLDSTKHSFFLFKNTPLAIIWTIDYETWQPLPEGKTIDWDKDIFLPTEHLLQFAKKEDIKLSFMVEMGEYYWLKENNKKIADRMEDQWKCIIRQSHDVQIHLHIAWLPECGAKYDEKNKSWFWNKKFQRIHEYPGDIIELLTRCKNDLERILKPINPKYQAIVFRAGQYQIQPFSLISNTFIKAGLIADTSVWRGGYRIDHHYDFRNAFSETQVYPAKLNNINSFAPQGEQSILELPISSFHGKRLIFDGAKGSFLIRLICEYIKRKRTNLIRYQYAHVPVYLERIIQKLFGYKEINSCLVTFYDRVLNKLFPPNKFLYSFPESFIATSHTKQILYFEEISKFISFIRNEFHTIKFTTISELALYSQDIFNSKEWGHERDELDHLKDIMQQCYTKLDPSRNHLSTDPKIILERGYAWCRGYVHVMQYFCEQEGFKSREYIVYAKNHPHGRGRRKIDTHEVIEVLTRQYGWVLCDPTTNRLFDCNLARLLRQPELVDQINSHISPDERWTKYSYEFYCSSWFYKNITKVRLRSKFYNLTRKIYYFIKEKPTKFFMHIFKK